MGLLDVYLELRPTLVRYFAAKTQSYPLAEDIVQEIYVKICGELNSSEIRDPKAWMFRVGTNIMIDIRRRGQRDLAREQLWAATDAPKGGEAASEAPSPETVAADRQHLETLLRLVDEMPPRMAEAFRLHKLQGFPQAEAARRMGVSTKAVEKHLTNALRRLTENLDKAVK